MTEEAAREVRDTVVAPDLVRRLAAEGIGTGMLVLFGAGSIVVAATTGGGELSYGSVGFIALAHALAIALAVYAFGGLSGAHINPAVTFGLAVVGRVPWREVVPYWGAQLVGGVIGGILVVAVFGMVAVESTLVGAPVLGDDATYLQGIVAEALGAFILLLTIMALAVDPRAPKGFAGMFIGLSVGLAVLGTAPVAGASLNPARTFGSYVPAGLFGGDVPWTDFLLYWIGPLLGGALATISYDVLARPKAVQVEPLPETPGAGGEVRGRP